MPIPLVNQLDFTRGKWLEGLRPVTADEAIRRFEPMNCISWMIAHLAYHEHWMWVEIAQGRLVVPEVNAFGWGQPASTPPLDEAWDLWERCTQAADEFLTTLTTADLSGRLAWKGERLSENTGTKLQRNIYHYWFHLGESQAVRQLLGHRDLPGFVGSVPPEAYYEAEKKT